MPKAVYTTLHGGMRGPRGQYRASPDNEYLHSENLIHERGGGLRNRPAAQDFTIDEGGQLVSGAVSLLPTDKMVPFEWNGKTFFFIYDPLYEFDWEALEEWSSGVNALDMPVQFDSEKSPDNPVAAVNLLANMMKKSVDIPRNERSPEADVDQFTASVFSRGSAGSHPSGVTRPSVGALLYNAFNDSQYTHFQIYQNFQILSNLSLLRVPFFIYDVIGEAWDTTVTDDNQGKHIRPLVRRMKAASLWSRFLIKNEEGEVVGNGVTRGMPHTYRIKYSSRSSGTKDFYPKADETPSRKTIQLEEDRSYRIAEGVGNFVAYDPQGHMPPLVIQGNEQGTHFQISELSTRYIHTGLRKRYIPSILSKEEFDNYPLWKGTGFFTRDNLSIDGNVVNNVEAFTIFIGLTDSQENRDKIKDAASDIEATTDTIVSTEKYAERFEIDFRNDELPLPHSDNTRNTLNPTYGGGRFREESALSPPRSIVEDRVLYGQQELDCRLRYSTENASEGSVRGETYVQANPFFEQCPVIEFKSELQRIANGAPSSITVEGERARESYSDTFYKANREDYSTAKLFPLYKALRKGVDSAREGLAFFFANSSWTLKPITKGLNGQYLIGAPTFSSLHGQTAAVRSLTSARSSLILHSRNDDIRFLEEAYTRYCGIPVWGISGGFGSFGTYFKQASGQSNRFMFSGAEGVESVLYVTKASSSDTVLKDIVLGPEEGGFGFSTSRRLRPQAGVPLTDYGYTLPLSDEGGVEIYWTQVENSQLVIGTSKGKLFPAGLDLVSMIAAKGTLNSSEFPSVVPPVYMHGSLYQVMADRDHLYQVEFSEERQRDTYPSASSPITDFLFDTHIIAVEAYSDTGRLLILTENGRLFCGLTHPRSGISWSELTFGQPVQWMKRIKQTLYLEFSDRVKKLNLNESSPIEGDAVVSLTLKHPSAYRMGEDISLPSMSQIKYQNGHLFGYFRSQGKGGVRIGTYKKPGGDPGGRFLETVIFGAKGMSGTADGIRFEFDSRTVEIDALHVKLTG